MYVESYSSFSCLTSVSSCNAFRILLCCWICQGFMAVVWMWARFVFPFTHWRTRGLFPVWSYYKYSFREHPCTTLSVDFLSFLLDKYLDGEWLDRMVGVVFNFWHAAKLFSTATTHQHVRVLIALCLSEDLILSRYICLMLAVLAGVCQHLIVAFICISITTSDIEHLFTGLFTIHISSSLKCLFKYFA